MDAGDFIKLLIAAVVAMCGALGTVAKLLLAEKDRQLKESNERADRWEAAAWRRREIIDVAHEHGARRKVARPPRGGERDDP
jgi:hypothetical protein